MTYVDPHVPDDQVSGQSKRQIAQDKTNADNFDKEVLFHSRSTYGGSPAAVRRMAAKAGKPVEPEWLPDQELQAKEGEQ